MIEDAETSDVWLLDLEQPGAPRAPDHRPRPAAVLGGRGAAALARRGDGGLRGRGPRLARARRGRTAAQARRGLEPGVDPGRAARDQRRARRHHAARRRRRGRRLAATARRRARRPRGVRRRGRRRRLARRDRGGLHVLAARRPEPQRDPGGGPRRRRRARVASTAGHDGRLARLVAGRDHDRLPLGAAAASTSCTPSGGTGRASAGSRAPRPTTHRPSGTPTATGWWRCAAGATASTSWW